MHSTLFITVAGGLVQNVDVTDDLDLDIVVIDFDVEGEDGRRLEELEGDLCALFKYPADKISDGDYKRFEDIKRRLG